MTETPEAARWRELAVLVTILLAATALRTWRLGSVPPGMTHDEAGHGLDAIAILEGARPIYETVGYGREPLYDYWVAGLMTVGGRTREVVRFSAVPLGLITLLATFAWTRSAYDDAVALVSVALQAVAFWPLSIGRQALRSSLLPALFTPAVFFFWRAVREEDEEPCLWRLGVFALLVGASLYTYIPARVLWVVFPLFLTYLALFHRPTFRRASRPTLTALGLGLLLAVPLFVYLARHPGVEQRLTMLAAPLEALARGDFSVVLSNARRFLSGFLVPGRGDDFLAYTVPGRAVFELPLGLLFLTGLGVSVTRWREPSAAFSLMWFLVGISPSLVTGPAASTTRSIGALPVVFLFPALAIVTGARRAGEHWEDVAGWLVALVSSGLILVTAVFSVCDYFVTWAESPHTRAAYQHTLVETAEYLDAHAEGGVVGVSTAEPDAPHDPYVFELSLDRSDLSLRWFDARRALVLPTAPNARLVVPPSASLSPAFAELPGFRLKDEIELRPDDLDPRLKVYDWRPRTTLTALLRRAQDGWVTASLETAASMGNGERRGLELPVSFGEAVDFLGYDLRTAAVVPGDEVELMTLWEVTNPGLLKTEDRADVQSEPVLFVHALDVSGNLLAQEDRLDAPAWAWHEGDLIAQIHRVTLPADLPEKRVILGLGIYRPSDMNRLSVSVRGDVVGDSIFLAPMEMKE